MRCSSALNYALLLLLAACGSGTNDVQDNLDASSQSEAGTSMDAGTSQDATHVDDGSEPRDAGADSSFVDAGSDANRGDANVDAAVISAECGGERGLDLLDVEGFATNSGTSVADVLGVGAGALEFGVDRSATYNENACLYLGHDREAFTFAFWVKLSGDVRGTPVLATRYPDDWFSRGLVLRAFTPEGLPGRTYLSLQGSDEPGESAHQNFIIDSVSFDKDAWTHVAVTVDYNKSVEIYVNLRAISSKQILEFGGDVMAAMPRLGSWSGLTEERVGSGTFAISDLRLFNRVLSQDDLRALALDKIGSRLSVSSLRDAMHTITTALSSGGDETLDDDSARAAVDTIETNLLLLTDDDDAIDDAYALLAAHDARLGQLFSPERLGLDVGTFGAAEHAAFVLQQALHDNLFTGANLRSKPLSLFRAFAVADFFPGRVSVSAPRVDGATVSVRATNIAPSYPIFARLAPLRRFTGLYAAPAEVVTVRVDPSLVGRGLSVLVGSHSDNLSLHQTLWRFPSVSKEFPIDAEQIQVANPYGGAISIMIPTGLDLGAVNVQISGAVRAPNFVMRGDRTTTREEWSAARTFDAPWASFEADKFMFELPSHVVRDYDYDDIITVLTNWNGAMDSYADLWARTRERHRAEYMLMDMQLPNSGAFGAGYPAVVEGFNPDSTLRPDWATFGVDSTSFPNFVYFHEFGHGHQFPMLPSEVETVVNLPAVLTFHQKMTRVPAPSLDTAFKYSGFQFLTRDQAAVDWMIADNFRAGRPIETTWDESNELRYQHRGHAKYVDYADLFGWDALGATFGSFARPGVFLIDITVDEFFAEASTQAHANIAPLLEFWGIFPSEGAIESSAEPLPSSIRDLICHYGSVAPRNNAEFTDHYNAVYETMGLEQQVRYDAQLTTFNDTTGIEIRSRVQAVVAKHYPGMPCAF